MDTHFFSISIVPGTLLTASNAFEPLEYISAPFCLIHDFSGVDWKLHLHGRVFYEGNCYEGEWYQYYIQKLKSMDWSMIWTSSTGEVSMHNVMKSKTFHGLMNSIN